MIRFFLCLLLGGLVVFCFAQDIPQNPAPDSASVFYKKAEAVSSLPDSNGKNKGLLLKYKGDTLVNKGQYFDALKQYQQAIIELAQNFTSKDIYQNPQQFSDSVSFSDLFNTLIAKAGVFEMLEHGQKNVKALNAALEAYRSALLLAAFVEKTDDSGEARLFLNKIKYTIHDRPVMVSLELYEITGKKKYLEDVYFFDQSNKASILFLTMQGKKMTEQLPSVPTLQQMIDNKTAVISYHLYDSVLLTLIITRNEFNYYRQRLPTDLYTAINSFRLALQNSLDQQHYNPEAAKKLYSILILPIHTLLERSDRLLIIPGDELNYLPFEALQDENNRYLLEEFAVQYQYSTALLGRSATQPKKGTVLSFTPYAQEIDKRYLDSSRLVVVSTDKANSAHKTTGFITNRLHEYMDEGYSKDKALQKARLDLLKNEDIEPRYKTPGYWAQFILIGKYEPPYKPTPWLLIAAVVSVAVAIILILTLKRNYW